MVGGLLLAYGRALLGGYAATLLLILAGTGITETIYCGFNEIAR